jgi:hypothetical protein
MTAKTITVWFSVYEDGEYLIESDEFPTDDPEEALQLAREDYPGCDTYSLTKLSM